MALQGVQIEYLIFWLSSLLAYQRPAKPSDRINRIDRIIEGRGGSGGGTRLEAGSLVARTIGCSRNCLEATTGLFVFAFTSNI